MQVTIGRAPSFIFDPDQSVKSFAVPSERKGPADLIDGQAPLAFLGGKGGEGNASEPSLPRRW